MKKVREKNRGISLLYFVRARFAKAKKLERGALWKKCEDTKTYSLNNSKITRCRMTKTPVIVMAIKASIFATKNKANKENRSPP